MSNPAMSVGRITKIKDRIGEIDQKLANPRLMQPIRLWLNQRRMDWLNILINNGA